MQVARPAPAERRALSAELNAKGVVSGAWIKEYGTLAGIVLALIAVALAMGRFTTFYSVDGEIKYLAAVAIAHHPLDPSIPYPFHRFDPRGAFTLPLTGWYNGHEYAGYSLPFLYLTGLCIAILGKAGVILPAILGTAALLVAQLRLAQLLEIKNTVLVLVTTVAATPILFYSLTLWEHTWGAALFMVATALLLRNTSAPQDAPRRGKVLSTSLVGALAGALLFASIVMRREMLIAALVLLALLPLVDRTRASFLRSAVALAVTCLPIVAILLLHPEPLALGLTHASPGHAPLTAAVAPSYLTKLGWLLPGTIPTIALAAWTSYLIWLRLRRRTSLPFMYVAGSLFLGPIFVVAVLAGNPQTSMNPLLFTPVALWGLWSVLLLDDSHAHGWAIHVAIWLLVIGGTVATFLFLPDTGGAQWGPRYLLVFFPLLIVLSLKAREEIVARSSSTRSRRVAQVVFVGLLAMSFCVQVIGVLSLNTSKRKWSETTAAIARLPGSVVVSTGDTTIDMFASLQPSKQLLWAQTRSDLRRLISDLHRDRVNEVDFVCAPNTSCPWNAWRGWKRIAVARSNHLRYAVFLENVPAAP